MGATSAHSRKLSTSSTKWSGWLDSNQRPPASEAGTLAGLSYTLLALRREIESLSPIRQTGRLTRCVTERDRFAVFRVCGSKESWCVWADSNGHWMRSQRIPSANWGTDADCRRLGRACETQHLGVSRAILGLARRALDPTYELLE